MRGAPVHLPPLAYKVLVHLVRNRGRGVTAMELRQHVWGGASLADDASVRNQIATVRSALGPASKGLIENAADGHSWGVGIPPAATGSI